MIGLTSAGNARALAARARTARPLTHRTRPRRVRDALTRHLPAGFVGMLDEPDDTLKAFGLTKLNGIVDEFWAEVADSLTKMHVVGRRARAARRHVRSADILRTQPFFFF